MIIAAIERTHSMPKPPDPHTRARIDCVFQESWTPGRYCRLVRQRVALPRKKLTGVVQRSTERIPPISQSLADLVLRIVLTIVLLSTLFNAEASCEEYSAKKGNLYALIVGVSQYRHPQIHKLAFADKDARDLAGVLRSQRHLYNNIHIKVLVNERATKDAIERVYSHGFGLGGKNDTLIFFFAGHGITDAKDKKGYLLMPYDADPNQVASTGVLYNPKKRADPIKAGKSAAIIDICLSTADGDPQGRPDAVSLQDLVSESGHRSDQILIVSVRTKELSEKYRQLKNGVFTHFLLKGLKGEADLDGNGTIDLSEAYQFVSSHISELTGGAQRLERAGREASPFVLWSRTKGTQAPRDVPKETKKGSLYCLAIGVSEYKHPKIPDLKYAEKDAQDFVDWVKSQRQLYKKIRVKLLMDERATKANIEKWLSKGCLSAEENDTVLLFFSGHGLADPSREDEYFVAAHDTDPFRLASTGVLLSGMSLIRKMKAGRALVIADTCMAGASVDLQSQSGGVSLAEFLRDFRDRPNRIVIASSSTPETSIEHPGLQNGVFTHFLLKGLKGEADFDKDGVVTVKEVYEYVSRHTRNYTDGMQNPELGGWLDGAFVLGLVTGAPHSSQQPPP